MGTERCDKAVKSESHNRQRATVICQISGGVKTQKGLFSRLLLPHDAVGIGTRHSPINNIFGQGLQKFNAGGPHPQLLSPVGEEHCRASMAAQGPQTYGWPVTVLYTVISRTLNATLTGMVLASSV